MIGVGSQAAGWPQSSSWPTASAAGLREPTRAKASPLALVYACRRKANSTALNPYLHNPMCVLLHGKALVQGGMSACSVYSAFSKPAQDGSAKHAHPHCCAGFKHELCAQNPRSSRKA